MPKAVLQRMDDLIPVRQRSRFIAEALAERLVLAEQLLALEESAGAWANESHREMADDEAIDRWLVDLRASWAMAGVLRTQKLLARLATLDLDRDIADWAGDLIASGKRAGRPLSVPDAIIAATAIGHGLTLVTLNQGDFQNIAGLSLYALDAHTDI